MARVWRLPPQLSSPCPLFTLCSVLPSPLCSPPFFSLLSPTVPFHLLPSLCLLCPPYTPSAYLCITQDWHSVHIAPQRALQDRPGVVFSASFCLLGASCYFKHLQGLTQRSRNLPAPKSGLAAFHRHRCKRMAHGHTPIPTLIDVLFSHTP